MNGTNGTRVPQRRQSYYLVAVALVVAVVTFGIDVSTPRGVAAGIFPYFIAIAIVAWSRIVWAPYAIAALASLFSIAGFMATDGGNPNVVLVNRLFLIGSFWLTAYLVSLKQQADFRREQAIDSLDEQVQARTAELQREQSNLQAALRSRSESEALLRLIADRLPALVAYTDQDTVLRFINARLAEDFSIDAAGGVGKSLKEALGPETSDLMMPHLTQVLAGEEFAHSALLVTQKGKRQFHISYVPDRFASGNVRGVVVLAQDVTEEREQERQLRQSQKLQALGQLTSGIAHDFNNLLAVIVGNLEMIEEQAQDDSASLPAIAAAIRAGNRGAEMTERLLSVSRCRPRNVRALDPNAVIAEWAEVFRRTLGGAIRIETALETDVQWIEADETQLQNSLLNLALNARDAMQGQGILTIATGRATLPSQAGKGRAGVVISLSDTGAGMSDEIKERAFEPFFTTKEFGKGTGLGLYMVYSFVRGAGGDITIESDSGRGTTIAMIFPAASVSQDLSIQQAAPSSSPHGDGERILLVEDDPDLRRIATDMLSSLGYAVTATHDAASAISAVAAGEPHDLLLADIMLPGGMNGFQLAGQILETQPTLPIVFMSGHAGRIPEGFFRGDSIVLMRKPFKKAELAAQVRDALLRTGTPAAKVAVDQS